MAFVSNDVERPCFSSHNYTARRARLAAQKRVGMAESPERSHHRLSAFIRHHEPTIVGEWVAFARTRTPASDTMSKLALEDHIADILKFIADDLDTPQSAAAQVRKSHGQGPPDSPSSLSAAEIHAALRLADGFNIDQMVSEYRALRASVVKLWVASNNVLAGTDVEDLTRFNEAIDQAMAESVAHYTKTINDSRNLFLGVLGHDLRNPIGAATMAAKRMVDVGMPNPKLARAAAEIVRTTDRATKILNDLLDLTRSAFGTDMPVAKEVMDLGTLCNDLADELRAVEPDRDIKLDCQGDTTGHWDKARMGQAFSNLIANALQHSSRDSPVTITVSGVDPDAIAVTVHNYGEAIASDKLEHIFQSWQLAQEGTHAVAGAHLGLGLFVTKIIMDAHGAEISVTSEAVAGTTFSVSLPRACD